MIFSTEFAEYSLFFALAILHTFDNDIGRCCIEKRSYYIYASFGGGEGEGEEILSELI
jgi:hypothetical protein